ncbi:MFS transporter [Streptomyces tauricus]|uniref:MFS transporter n=1 Tax=Streptomyces TaxID=1883 RepID=UPI00339F312E
MRTPSQPDSDPARAAAPPSPVRWDKVGVLVGGQALAQGGSFVLLIAMSWTAVQLGGAGGVSLVLLASSLPRALMLIFGGALADLLGPRFVLLRTTAARVLVLLAGAVTVFTVESLWLLMVIGALEGSLLGLGGPASSSLMPHFAKGDGLARANSLYAMVVRLAPVAGTPVGAWLIATGHLGHALLVTAGTCTAWLGCLLYVTRGLTTPVREGGASMVRRSGDGFRLLAGLPRLRWMFVAAFTLDLAFNWPLEVALPLLVDERGWNVTVVGVVIAAFGAGALVSSALGAVLAHRIPLFIRLVATGAGIAAGILTMALLPSVAGLCTVAATVGMLSGFNGPAMVTVYQQSAPPNRMGAAMSTLALAGIGTAPASIALFSSVSLLLGVSATWLLCGLVACFSPVAALLSLRHPPADSPADGDGDAAAAGPVPAPRAQAEPRTQPAPVPASAHSRTPAASDRCDAPDPAPASL